MSVANELTKLVFLRDEGVITPDEFERQKVAALGGGVDPALTQRSGAFRMLKTAGITIAVCMGAFVVLAIILAISAPHKTRSEQIMDGCKREFADQEWRVNECALALTLREAEAADRAKLERAGQ